MIDTLFNQLKNDGYNFFTGVPDSALKPFQNSILESKLEKAQSFQDIIVDRKDEFNKYLKETNNLSTFKLV